MPTLPLLHAYPKLHQNSFCVDKCRLRLHPIKKNEQELLPFPSFNSHFGALQCSLLLLESSYVPLLLIIFVCYSTSCWYSLHIGSITTDFIVFVVVIMQHAFRQACIVGSFFANII